MMSKKRELLPETRGSVVGGGLLGREAVGGDAHAYAPAGDQGEAR